MLATSSNNTTKRLALLASRQRPRCMLATRNLVTTTSGATYYWRRTALTTMGAQSSSSSSSSLLPRSNSNNRAWLSTGGGNDGDDNDKNVDDKDDLEKLITDIKVDDDDNDNDDDDELLRDVNEMLSNSRRKGKKDADDSAPLRRATKKDSLPVFGKKNVGNDDLDPFVLKRKKKLGKLHAADDDGDDFGTNNYPMLELLELQDHDDPIDNFLDNSDENDDNQEIRAAQKAAETQKRAEQKEEMDHKTGRGWTDPWDLEEMFASNETYDDLPDWSPKFVSKMSQERVQILQQGIPSLSELAAQPLPPPPHPHPGHGHTKAYALYRSRYHAAYIYEKVQALAAPRIPAIQALTSYQDKQDAVDELFERIEFTLHEQEAILGKHPKFGEWVEKALEKYLQTMQKTASSSSASDSGSDSDSDSDSGRETSDTAASSDLEFPSAAQDQAALPVFMDCFVPDVDSEDKNIPQILRPLAPLARGANQGRMMEEWQLAAHKTTKRILLRQSTRSIAQFMLEHEAGGARILVTGRQGTGKTAALLSIVAAARQSGHVVLFLPHVSMLAEHGYYIEPSEHRPGVYDLPVLSEQVCGELLASHKDDLASIPMDTAKLDVFFAPDQLSKLSQEESMSVADLLAIGAEKRSLAPMCYSAAMDALMNQDIKPFVMVLDEFNTLFQDGKYFHEHYDETVRKAIPYNQINLFQPAMDAMGLVVSDKELLPEPVLMKRGAVIAGMSLSKPVGDKINAGLEACGKELAALPDSKFHLSEVPRLTNLEVDHVMANFETIGFGKLRMDQGETVANPQEVAYHRILSGSVPHELMNACVM